MSTNYVFNDDDEEKCRKSSQAKCYQLATQNCTEQFPVD